MRNINLTVNGDAVSATDEPRMHLADFVRERLRLTGTHLGCEHGVCGACTLLVDGVPVRSCITLAVACDGASITTIEGMSTDALGKALQDAWVAEDVPQCGYCQSGQIMSAAVLLREKPQPTDEDIDLAMSGNICRCGTYQRIRCAIHRAAEMKAKGGAK